MTIRHYIAVVRHKDGVYRARFPDFPSCPDTWGTEFNQIERCAKYTITEYIKTLEDVPPSSVLNDLDKIPKGSVLLVIKSLMPNDKGIRD